MKKTKRTLSLILVLTLVLGVFSIGAFAADNNEVTIYLIRHGRTLFNTIGKVQGWADTPLTDAGIEGAEDTAMGLANVKFDAAYSSDRGRAIETAEIILGLNAVTPASLPLHQTPDLRETNFGKYEATSANVWGTALAVLGGTMADMGKFSMKEIIDAMATTDETGECEDFDELIGRLMRGMDTAATSVKSGNVLVVAHGAAIGNIVSALGGPGMSGEIPNSSVTILTYKNGKYSVGRIGDLTENAAGAAIRAKNGGKAVVPANKQQSSGTPAPGSSKVNLYFVRHGKTTLNTARRMQGWADAPLTAAGVQGVINTGIGLSNIRFDAVYSSDLYRTIETVDLMLSVNAASGSDIPRTKLKDLREYGFGIYEGELDEDVYPVFMAAAGVSGFEDMIKKGLSVTDLYDAAAKDPASLMERKGDFSARVQQGVNHIASVMSNESHETNVMVVVHGIVMGEILGQLGIPVYAEIPNAAVVKVTYQSGKFSIDKDNAIDLSYSQKGAESNPRMTHSDAIKFSRLSGKINVSRTAQTVPVLFSGSRAYFPIELVAKALGGSAGWDTCFDACVMSVDGHRVSFDTGSNQFQTDNVTYFMRGAYTYYDKVTGYTFAPAEYILRDLGISYSSVGANLFLNIPA